jgi:hypothetical protein
MLMGNRRENRRLERILISLWSVVNPFFVGKAARYRGITGEDLAKAMKNAAKNQSGKLNVYHWKEMNDLLHR